jgi:SAM-dependent methyltransferase
MPPHQLELALPVIGAFTSLIIEKYDSELWNRSFDQLTKLSEDYKSLDCGTAIEERQFIWNTAPNKAALTSCGFKITDSMRVCDIYSDGIPNRSAFSLANFVLAKIEKNLIEIRRNKETSKLEPLRHANEKFVDHIKQRIAQLSSKELENDSIKSFDPQSQLGPNDYKEPPSNLAKAIADYEVRALRILSGPILIDIGGEGRYLNAINLNPFTSIQTTTGNSDSIHKARPIINLVRGFAQNLPFDDKTAQCVIMEQIPLNPEPQLIGRELKRVVAPGGFLFVSNPQGAEEDHDQITKDGFKLISRHIVSDTSGVSIVASSYQRQ